MSFSSFSPYSVFHPTTTRISGSGPIVWFISGLEHDKKHQDVVVRRFLQSSLQNNELGAEQEQDQDLCKMLSNLPYDIDIPPFRHIIAEYWLSSPIKTTISSLPTCLLENQIRIEIYEFCFGVSDKTGAYGTYICSEQNADIITRFPSLMMYTKHPVRMGRSLLRDQCRQIAAVNQEWRSSLTHDLSMDDKRTLRNALLYECYKWLIVDRLPTLTVGQHQFFTRHACLRNIFVSVKETDITWERQCRYDVDWLIMPVKDLVNELRNPSKKSRIHNFSVLTYISSFNVWNICRPNNLIYMSRPIFDVSQNHH